VFIASRMAEFRWSAASWLFDQAATGCVAFIRTGIGKVKSGDKRWLSAAS
jgi:hypothetical protein